MAECDNAIENLSASQLRRFLYLGINVSFWKPKTCLETNPEGIIHLLLKEGKGSEIVQTVLRFYKEGCAINADALAYALAVCSLSTNKILKQEVFAAAKEMCTSAPMMLAFVNYHKTASQPKCGWGRFVRRFLSSWYNDQEAKHLAVEITQTIARHKWTHKDILCVSHIKAAKPETAVVLKYLMKGLDEAAKEYGSVPEAQDVLSYLKAVDELKHTTDHQKAAYLIETHKLNFEHIPSTLLKSKEIWSCLVPRLKTSELLLQIPRLSRLGLLKLNSPYLKNLLERLRDENALGDGDLGPLETFLAVRRWEASNRVIPGRQVARQNVPQLEEALMNLHMASFKAIPSTGKRYLVVLDVCATMATTHVFGCNSLSPADVSMVVLMALARSEVSNVTALAFSTSELVPVDINNKMSLSDVSQRMRNVTPGPVHLTAPILWAQEQKKAFDLILVFTDNQTGVGNAHLPVTLKEYKKTLNLPHTRFLTFSLNSKATALAAFDDVDMLHVAGFHVKILQVIQDFARKVF